MQCSAVLSVHLTWTKRNMQGTGLHIAMLPCMSCNHAPQAAPCCCPCLLCRDPKHFGVILNCLRCGGGADAAAKLLPVTRAEQRELLLEAQYYGEARSCQSGCLHGSCYSELAHEPPHSSHAPACAGRASGCPGMP